MATCAMPAGQQRADTDCVETLIFVDIDGVLSVGVRDQGAHALELTAANLQMAASLRDSRGNFRPEIEASSQAIAERLEATASRTLAPEEGSGATYAKFVGETGVSFSEVLVGRLAEMLHATEGIRTTVVLSSTWRLEKFASRVRGLESAISRHLGKPFAFHAKTELWTEPRSGDRLRNIGNFIEQHCGSRVGRRSLRVLVLDDFAAGAIGEHWSHALDGHAVRSTADCEKYLERRGGQGVSARLIHTYDAWTTASGLVVQIGSGILLKHLRDAVTFLTGESYGAVDECKRADQAASVQADRWKASTFGGC